MLPQFKLIKGLKPLLVRLLLLSFLKKNVNFVRKYIQDPSNDLDTCRYHVGTKPLVSVGTLQTGKSAIKGAPFRYLGLLISLAWYFSTKHR
jgi:hypothetical protein